VHAWVLSAFGLENLDLVERPAPSPGPGQVVVRVRAAALNSRDLQVVANQYDPNQRLPIVPVSDGVGDVVAIGAGVTRVREGDRVLPVIAQRWVAGERTWERWLSHVGGHYDGMLQEYCLLEAEGVCTVPAGLTDVEAAACGVAAATAWEALVERGRLTAGQTVLVQGTGGVAMFALQFARLHGARVIVTSSSDEKLARARALGATGTVNYRTTPDWDQEVLRLTGGEGCDHVVETAGELDRSVNALRVGGTVSLAGYTAQLRLGDPSPEPWAYRLGVIPVLLKQARMQGLSGAPRESYERMLRAIDAADLKPVIGAVIPFAQAPEAFQTLEAGRAMGKVCVQVAR
jgi:NADPH:quinone reductase-like Zn-dependent oxidoreductase